MRAIIQTDPETVALQNIDDPEADDDEVLVRVHTAGICGSDAHAYKYDGGYEWIPIPRIMGHEFSGTVVEVGNAVDTYRPGDKVVEEPIHNCGECYQCKNGQPNVCQNFSITGMHRDGAYADYTVVKPEHLHKVPETVPLEHAAITEPISIATRAVLTRSGVTSGDYVLVEGPGPIGALCAIVADSVGASVLVSGLEKDQRTRLPLIENMGISTVNIHADDMADVRKRFTNARSFDVVFDTTGHHTGIEMAVEHVRKGGEVVSVGLPGDPSEVFMTPVVRGEINLNSSYGSRWRNFEQALRLMANGTIDPSSVLDFSYSISEPSEAFSSFLDSETLKPVFSFDGE
jgi:L-iditol 2-dehydrogenase